MIKQKTLLFYIIISFTIISTAFPQAPQRKDVPEKYKWNLSDMYPTVADWQKDINKVESEINNFASFKGNLGKSSQNLLNALDSYFDMLKTFYKAGTYASNLSNEDVRISENQALQEQLSSVGTKFGETAAFFEPEILTISKEKIEKFFKEKPELKTYSMYIDNIQRLRPHTLTESEEKILASFGLIANNQDNVYSIFNNGEKPSPKITLSTGESVELSPSAYTRVRAAENRD